MMRLINHSLQMFFKIGALQNLVIFTGKNLCWGLVNKVADLFPTFRLNTKRYSEMRGEGLQLC